MNIWHDRKDYVMATIEKFDKEAKEIEREMARLSGPSSARRVQELWGQHGDATRGWNKWNRVAWENGFYDS